MGGEIEFKSYEQHQGSLFPAHLSEALDPGDPVFFISDWLDSTDVAVFEQRYAVLGERAYPPRMLLKLWLFGAIEGVYSGREIARRLRWDLRFRYLAGGLEPDFRTLNRFRVRHREDFEALFRQTVRSARASGLAKLGRIAIDGTKIRANTSRHKAMSHQRMKQAEERERAEIARILAEMEKVNSAEDAENGDDDDHGGLPEELQSREKRLAKLRAVREQLEQERGEKLKPKNQKSFADPDANMMKTSEGALTYCYNAQAATSEDGIIVATGTTTQANDVEELIPMVEKVRENTGRRPKVTLADTGYLSEANLEAMKKKRHRCLIAVGREGKKAARWPKQPRSQGMHRLFRLPWARKLYAHRKTQGERPFAQIKNGMKFRRFSLRGRSNTRGEWNLVCSATNLLTLCRAMAT